VGSKETVDSRIFSKDDKEGLSDVKAEI
jgi:hypothetical protein